ncbi:MAG TPA: hypothetical protein VNM22_14250 [Candidatus Limnocylindrales bacterium]|nr:hypothetical protein [Candidatus Limnocylindrales bacterium]
MKFLKNEYLQAAFATAVFLSVFFWQPLFLGRSIVDTRIHYTDPIYQELGIHSDHYPFFRPDPFYALFDHPALIYSYQTLKDGQIPLWNPYSAGGMPFLANFTASSLFPLKLPFYFSSSPMRVYNYYLISRLFFAGFFTYILARMLDVGRYGALLSGISYMTCGFLIAYFQYNVTPPAFMPLLFVTLQKVLTTSKSSSILFLGAVIGLIFLAEHASTSIILLAGLGLYSLVWIFQHGTKSSRSRAMDHGPLLALLMAGILGVSLSFVTLLPFLEFLQNAHTYKEEEGHTYLRDKRLDEDGLRNLAGLFIPHYKAPWFASSPYLSSTYAYQSYAGLVTLTLALYALISRKINWSLGAVLVLGCGLAFGLAPFSILSYIVPLRYTLAQYGLILVAFPLALFGGMGLDALLSQERKARGRLQKLIGVVGFIAINFFAGFSRQVNWINSPWSDWKRLLYTGVILISIYLIYLAYLRFDSVKPKFLAKGLILLAILDLFYNGYWVNFPQPEFHFPETTPIRVLKEDRGIYRILSMNGVNRLNSGLVHQLSDIQVINPILVYRYYEFLKTAEDSAGQPYSLIPDFYDSRFWDLLNMKYILRDSGKPLPATEKFRLIYQDPHMLIYENLKAFPRVFPVHQVIITENPDQSLQRLKDPALDLRHTAILELSTESRLRKEIDSLSSLSLTSKEVEKIESTAEITLYSPHRVIIEANMKVPGILILGDTWYPGWKVRIDNRPDTLLPTDYLFRGVYLKEGPHTVEFIYDPLSYKLGLYVSLFSLSLYALSCLICIINRVRPYGWEFCR